MAACFDRQLCKVRQGTPRQAPRCELPGLAQVMEELIADKALGAKLAAPSISHGAQNLYMRGVLEEATRENLDRVRPRPCLWFGYTFCGGI